MIPDSVLQEIVAANDIVEIASSYLTLKKGGKDFKALCPFHNEKTPSFTVSPSKQMFYCFGCSAGGDVIGLVMKIERLEFPEALEFLARKKGIDLSAYANARDGMGSRGPADGVGKTRLYQINKEAEDFFAANLKSQAVPQEYLKRRGITGITARDFGLGWAPPAWDSLLRWAQQKGLSKKELLAAGLVLASEETPGQYHDRFRARVIFPLCDTQDRVLAFSGRVLDDALPKYINSPETAVFSKGATLFGLNMAKEAIVKAGWTAVCEGPMDMIAVYQAGLRNIVASQGTAFTQRHAKLIKRFTQRVVLCFDGDQAGQMASLRSWDAFLAEGMEVKIAVLPPKEDPDSFVRSRGVESLKSLLDGAADFLTFRLDRLKCSNDLKSEIGKAQAAKEVLADLVKLPSAVHQNSCVGGLAQMLGVQEEALWLEFKKLQKQGGKALPQRARESQGAQRDLEQPGYPARELRAIPPWEMDWVASVIQNEPLLEREAQEGHFEMLSDEVLSGIVRTAVGQYRMSTYRGIASVSVLFKGEREAEVLALIASRSVGTGHAQGVYEEGILRFRRRALETRIKGLNAEIQRREQDKVDVSECLTQVVATKRELLILQDQEGALRR